MKHETDPIREHVRQQSHNAGDNPYFTPRVLNRLPPKRRRRQPIALVVALLVIATCAVNWTAFINNEQDVITVRDLINLIIMSVITIAGVAGCAGLFLAKER